ncbi:MAG: glycosyl hydrolase, partial [Mariniphaga sp.]|nr:glycosyl hydrolase [Mariniphaga sp.]
RLMYDRMVNHHGLKNLIWVWTSQQNDYNWYPGDDVVDIIGRDIYKEGDHSSQILEFNQLNDMFGGKKMITLSECGSFPDADNLVEDEVPWSYFMPWYGIFVRDSKYNSLDLWEKMLAHDYVLTLDEMPELKTYVSSSANPQIQHSENGLKVFPTFISNELNIYSRESSLNISVFSVSGNLINSYSFSSPKAVISFSGYQTGIYFIKINTFKTLRVVKINHP